MKIFRSELEKGLENKFFEIPGDTFDSAELCFASDVIIGKISSEHAMHGYLLKGSLTVPFIESCDRCLVNYEIENEIDFVILLTNQTSLLDNNEHQVLYFSGQEDSVEINPVLAEIMFLEKPLKKLCSQDCKGLCPTCGINRNDSQCDCAEKGHDSPWDILKEKNNE